MASGDRALVNMAADILQRTAHEVDIATLNSVASVELRVSDLDAEFGRFVQVLHNSNNEIANSLEHHKVLIRNLGADLKKLSKDITAVHEEVRHLGHNQDLLVDFLFSDLPPDEKVLALKSGLMDHRIRCPKDGDAACNREELRATLIERYETESIIRKNVATAGKILQSINGIQTITTNLGIDIGEEGRTILKFADGAVNAYMSILSGNPLARISHQGG